MQDIIKKFDVFKEKKIWISIIIFRIKNEFLNIINKKNKRKNSMLKENTVNLYSIGENKIKELNKNTIYSILLTYKFNMQNFNFDKEILNKILYVFINKFEIIDNENNLLPKDLKINVDDKDLKEIENIIEKDDEIIFDDVDNFDDNNNKIINNDDNVLNNNENDDKNNKINDSNENKINDENNNKDKNDSNISENNKLNNDNINENNANNEIENNNNDDNNINIENNNNINEINNIENNNII
jgi:hypothetical protein